MKRLSNNQRQTSRPAQTRRLRSLSARFVAASAVLALAPSLFANESHIDAHARPDAPHTLSSADRQTRAFLGRVMLAQQNAEALERLEENTVRVRVLVEQIPADPPWLFELLHVFYSQRNWDPVFSGMRGPTAAGHILLDRFERADAHGLSPSRYLTPQVEELLELLQRPYVTASTSPLAALTPGELALVRQQLARVYFARELVPGFAHEGAQTAFEATSLVSRGTDRRAQRAPDEQWRALVARQGALANELELALAEGLIRYMLDMRVGNTSLAPSEPAMARADAYLSHVGYFESRTSDSALAELPADFAFESISWERSPEEWQLDEADWVLARAAGVVHLAEELDRLVPGSSAVQAQAGVQHDTEYQSLVDALERYRVVARAGGWAPIERSAPLVIGATNVAVPALRQHMIAEGYLRASPDVRPNDVSSSDVDEASDLDVATDEDEWRFTPRLAAALRRWKVDRLLPDTAELDHRTREALAVPVEERIAAIILALQALRHSSAESSEGELHVRINVPAFRTELWDEGRMVGSWRAIVGSTRGAGRNETPMFSARMTEIAFRPNWYPPARLARIGQENEQGQVVVPPGPSNPMGLVKFLFPNPDAIYMHDTNHRELFGGLVRAHSSGCVRVDEAVAVATSILERVWDVSPEEAARRVEAKLNGRDNARVYLPEPVPVHIEYRSAWMTPQGRVAFGPDIYGHEADAAESIVAAVYAEFPMLPVERASDRRRRRLALAIPSRR